MSDYYTPEHAPVNESEMFAFNFNKLLSSKNFVKVVVVSSVSDDGKTVAVMPLVKKVDATNNPVDNSIVYGIPVAVHQGGKNAVINPPAAGDIGLVLVNDNDMSQVKSTKVASLATTKRTHSLSDGVYLMSILGADPTQYVKFNDSGIDIKSTGGVTITSASDVNINGLKISSSGTLTLVDGSVVDKHTHGGVESGSSSTRPLGS